MQTETIGVVNASLAAALNIVQYEACVSWTLCIPAAD